jgi:lipopolysaccharide/colanic/teichoic acid biosynthesis glycosyltransferase
MNSSLYIRFGKRCFDAAVSLVSLFLLGPPLLLVAIAVRVTSAGPALFLQTRFGQFEKPFRILKFRTMRTAPAGQASLLTAAGDSRITPLGRWLRKTKIDELPQLFNVLVGHMSLVGPRPEVPRFISTYTASQKGVFATRPGITGPSIILNEEELMAGKTDKELFYLSTILPAKLAVDLDYCSHITFRTDLQLIFLTLGRLFRRASPSSVPGTIEHLSPFFGSRPSLPDPTLPSRSSTPEQRS